jgi:exodeoxyribonuclease-3
MMDDAFALRRGDLSPSGGWVTICDMKIVSWNVNSLNVRLPHVLDFLARHQPDVLALQETKLPDDKFPVADIEAAGYQVAYSGQKTYNGVAIISRQGISDVVVDLPGLDDPQRRLMAANIDGIRVIDVYIPNGQEVGSEKYAYKMTWLNALREFLAVEINRHERLVLLGDFNIAPADIDVHDPKRWHEKIMCSSEERAQFHALLGLGLHDCVRGLYPDDALHSWWDYRMSAFRRQWGIRIDLVLATAGMKAVKGGVATEFRALERPSDHAPVWVDFE